MTRTSSRFLQKNIESLVGLGVDESELMVLVPGGSAALGNPLVRFDGEVLISVLERAETLSGDRAIGFRCGLNHGHVIYTDIAYTILYCNNLRHSFDVSYKYEALAQEYGINVLNIVDTDEAEIIWCTHEDAPNRLRHITDLSFATLARMGLWIKAVHGLSVTAMTVRHTDHSYHKLYASLFDCPIEYGAQEDVLRFDKRFLDCPLPSANPAVLKLLTARLDQDLLAMEGPVSEEAQVAAYIEKFLGETPATLSHIAPLMHVSERSLRRRLQQTGTSFRYILESVRRDRYQILIQQPELSQAQIAGLLGYSEQSALTRAYKKWYGASPVRGMG